MDSISCVIPTHGRRDLLAESLRSASTQSPDLQLEIVVVDDLAEQTTRDLVEGYAFDNPQISYTYLARQAGGGASRSRNVGASECTGDIIAFLDDDDLWDADYLATAVAALKIADADMTVTWMNKITRDGTVVPHYAIEGGLQAGQVVARNPGITGSNIAIRRSAFESVGGFDENLPVSNDKDFFLRFLRAGFSYEVVDRRYVYHRQHSGDQLTAWNERRAAGLESYLRKHRDSASTSDKRFLQRQIHSIRLRTAVGYPRRFGHLILLLLNSEPSELVEKIGTRMRRVRHR